MTDPPSYEVVLVRHGETGWSREGRHTGRTDVPLTDAGRQEARLLAEPLGAWRFARVLTSPLERALDTCRLAGYWDAVEVRDDLMEWDYGDYEGRSTADIRAERPGWTLWAGGVPGGEPVESVGVRADRVVAEVRRSGGDVLLFAHGHLLRVLAARWAALPPEGAAVLALGTASISVLGYERERPVIQRWNEAWGLGRAPRSPRR